MIRNMVTATNTMGQLQKQLDLISNNIANVNTYGYKENNATFTSLLTQEFQNQRNDAADRNTPLGIRIGVGAKLGQTQYSKQQGAMQDTGRLLDFAFEQTSQYFKVLVQDENGEQEINYTRNGAFNLSPINADEVMLVDGQGNPILDQNDNVILFDGDNTNIGLNDNGTLVISNAGGGVQAVELGIVNVQRPQMMERVSNEYYSIPDNLAELGVDQGEVLVQMEGGLRQDIALRQRALEQSNVDLPRAFTDLINVQRNYQFHSRAISISDQMLGLVNGLR
ncbi:flagellar hook-basal body protein [Jeotgalibacillus soli]|uniref:Uncharacterized protein n=1 Tax=Jeotgalibacillus soli TaxID=889306 RepID=A0A0C2RHY8_9BACL|nr:flagellar hook-basal body protein [Jeotgalibacillus soli]KIL49785.1 hypothetical protein KP78_12530 [Jeotgalibacillus soli]